MNGPNSLGSPLACRPGPSPMGSSNCHESWFNVIVFRNPGPTTRNYLIHSAVPVHAPGQELPEGRPLNPTAGPLTPTLLHNFPNRTQLLVNNTSEELEAELQEKPFWSWAWQLRYQGLFFCSLPGALVDGDPRPETGLGKASPIHLPGHRLSASVSAAGGLHRHDSSPSITFELLSSCQTSALPHPCMARCSLAGEKGSEGLKRRSGAGAPRGETQRLVLARVEVTASAEQRPDWPLPSSATGSCPAPSKPPSETKTTATRTSTALSRVLFCSGPFVVAPVEDGSSALWLLPCTQRRKGGVHEQLEDRK
ncbi:uncharacterized protein LOC123802883 [Ursus americanus]|uniref:uncharacterized protein LOC123802883 n=1 Tax=Ursus americanus TaxID=9643 RepID=UPI001E67B852|nr:uncharacterized protein LOC123802883 [Ursus americanus]